MKIEKTEKEFYEAFDRKGLRRGVGEAVAEVLNLEFQPESKPAEESWPARLSYRDTEQGAEIAAGGLPWWIDLDEINEDRPLTEEERKRLRELVARFNAWDRIAQYLSDTASDPVYHTEKREDTLAKLLQEEREKLP